MYSYLNHCEHFSSYDWNSLRWILIFLTTESNHEEGIMSHKLFWHIWWLHIKPYQCFQRFYLLLKMFVNLQFIQSKKKKKKNRIQKQTRKKDYFITNNLKLRHRYLLHLIILKHLMIMPNDHTVMKIRYGLLINIINIGRI